MTAEPFAQMLKRLRTEAGLSQNQLAKRAGIDTAYVNRLERDRFSAGCTHPHAPARAVVVALAGALGLGADAADRLLYSAGLSPAEDWQLRAYAAEARLAEIAELLRPRVSTIPFVRRTG